MQPPQQAAVPAYTFDSAAPLAAQLGANMVSSTIGKYLPFASALWHSLRYYFDVNNSYVQNKLRILLTPFRHRNWKRVTSDESGGAMHDPYTAVRGHESVGIARCSWRNRQRLH